MMMSSKGNTCRVTGHLCREFTDHQWIPHTKASDAELWGFLWSVPEQTVGQTAGDFRRHRAHYDVNVMFMPIVYPTMANDNINFDASGCDSLEATSQSNLNQIISWLRRKLRMSGTHSTVSIYWQNFDSKCATTKQENVFKAQFERTESWCQIQRTLLACDRVLRKWLHIQCCVYSWDLVSIESRHFPFNP